VCVIGEVACGKTSFLQAIIGDMIYVSNKTVSQLGGMEATMTGDQLLAQQKSYLSKPLEEGEQPIIVRGSISYSEQNSWLRNMTIRDNILFGKPMDDVRYV